MALMASTPLANTQNRNNSSWPDGTLTVILRVGLSSDESESVLLFDALW